MNSFLTQKEKEEIVYNTFTNLVKGGKTKTQATYECMRIFNYTTPCTIFNIRKRVEGRL